MKLSQALRVKRAEVVSFVGGGGKTTAMFQLAHELAFSSRLLMTTTTHFFTAQITSSPAHVFFDPARQSLNQLIPRLNQAIDQHGQVLLIAPSSLNHNKVDGLSPQSIDYLAASGYFDVVIIEADGSRQLPFKTPAAHEPPIPSSSTLIVPVVGLDILGQLLTEKTVHRANLVSHLSSTDLGQPVTMETVAAVISHLEGGLKNVPCQARIIPLLNKADLLALNHFEQNPLSTKLLACDRIDSVIMGAVKNRMSPIAEVQSRIAAVILAAGGSRRFGSPKQLTRWGEKTFLEHAVEVMLASSVNSVVVVLGAEVEQSMALLAHQSVQIVINEQWAIGQSSSLQAGLAALPETVGAVLFLPIDMPGITPQLINAIIQRYRQTLAPVVWPEFEGQRGNPVLFDRTLFPELWQISGDTGGRAVLLAHQQQAERVAVTERAVLLDIDCPMELQSLR